MYRSSVLALPGRSSPLHKGNFYDSTPMEGKKWADFFRVFPLEGIEPSKFEESLR